MNMMTWIDMIPLQIRTKMMEEPLLEPYKAEWTWELAIVEPSIIKDVYKRFPIHTKLVLDSLLTGLGAVFTEEYVLINDLKRKLCLSGLQVKKALQQLAKLGICIVIHHPWQQRMWKIPFPIFVRWSHYALGQQSKLWTSQVDFAYTEAEPHYANSISLGKQLLYFLHQLQQVDMSFTRKGRLSKQSLDALQRECRIDERILVDLFADQLEQLDYSAYITFMLELGSNLGIIVVRSEGLTYNWAQLEKWLQLSQWQREHQLMQIVFEAYLGDKHQQTMLAQIGQLISLQPDTWYQSTVSLEEQQTNLFELCSQFGWIEWMLAEKAVYVRLVYFPDQTAEQIAVQDNGEIIALPAVDFVTIWHLEHLAERVLNQEVTIYRLTAKKLQAAQAANYGKQAIRKLLTLNENEDLPIFVHQLLESADLSNSDDTVPKISLQALLHTSYVKPLAVAGWGQWLSMPNIQCYRHPLAYEQLDTLTNLLELDRVSTSWYKEFRAYHPSTSKQIVAYAIGQELTLQLIIKGKNMTYIPEQIVEADNHWQVEGVFERQQTKEKVALQIDDWSAMKLHFHE